MCPHVSAPSQPWGHQSANNSSTMQLPLHYTLGSACLLFLLDLCFCCFMLQLQTMAHRDMGQLPQQTVNRLLLFACVSLCPMSLLLAPQIGDVSLRVTSQT
jgi:hypothetical protein